MAETTPVRFNVEVEFDGNAIGVNPSTCTLVIREIPPDNVEVEIKEKDGIAFHVKFHTDRNSFYEAMEKLLSLKTPPLK